MRRTSFGLALVLTLIASAALAHYPETIKIEEAAKKMAPVTFPHAMHGDKLVKSCDVCHHTQKGLTKQQALDNKIDIIKCSTCHLDPKDAKIPSMREMSATKNPFHIRCISCHKTEKKGPTVCTQCHKK